MATTPPRTDPPDADCPECGGTGMTADRVYDKRTCRRCRGTGTEQ